MSGSSRPKTPATRLFVIGGAEDRVGSTSVLRRFVRLAGSRRAQLALIPTASSFQAEAVTAYREAFTRLGVARMSVVNPRSRADAGRPEDVLALDEATGIFLSGGSQLRLSQYLLGTPLEAALHRAHARGCVVGGTSAGASIMSQFMISMGDDGASPRQRTSQLTAGLGLIQGVVIDQHFAQRQRYGRLMAVCAGSPSLVGIGLDENTAIEVRDRLAFTVHGTGTAFVIDCRAAVTDAPGARRGAPLLVSGAVVHALPAGATFDLRTMTLVDFVEKHPDLAVAVATAKE